MWAIVASVMSTLVAMTVIGGLLIRFALVPYMRKELADPLTVQIASIIQLANEAVQQVNVIAQAWDGHLEWSQREVDRLWTQMLVHDRLIARQRTGDPNL